MNNDIDTHDMEKLENLYGQMITESNDLMEEGRLTRARAGLNAYGQTAGRWVGGIGRALLGKGNLPARVFRLYYKVRNLVKEYANDINVIAGSTVYYDEVNTFMLALESIAKGSSPEKESAVKLLNILQPQFKKTSRPRMLVDLDKLIKTLSP